MRDELGGIPIWAGIVPESDTIPAQFVGSGTLEPFSTYSTGTTHSTGAHPDAADVESFAGELVDDHRSHLGA
jgi:hypothetical protein